MCIRDSSSFGIRIHYSWSGETTSVVTWQITLRSNSNVRMTHVMNSLTIARQTQVFRRNLRLVYGVVLRASTGSCDEQTVFVYSWRTFSGATNAWWSSMYQSIPRASYTWPNLRHSLGRSTRRVWPGDNKRELCAQPCSWLFLLFHVSCSLSVLGTQQPSIDHSCSWGPRRGLSYVPKNQNHWVPICYDHLFCTQLSRCVQQ